MSSQDYSYWATQAAAAAQKYGIDPNLFVKQMSEESAGFDPDVVSGQRLSPAGAIGIAQFMPGTAQGVGVNPYDPQASLDAAARLMAQYIGQYGGWQGALTAYNAGPGSVGGPLPAETQRYIGDILGGQGATPMGNGDTTYWPGGGVFDPNQGPLSYGAASSAYAQTGMRLVDLGNGISILVDQYGNNIGSPIHMPTLRGQMTDYQRGEMGLGYARLGQEASQFQQTEAERAREFADRSGLDWQKLDWDNRHYDQTYQQRAQEFQQTFGLDYDKFQEAKSEFQQRYGLDVQRLQQEGSQYQQTEAEKVREFDSRLSFDIQSRQQDVAQRGAELDEKRREFDASTGIERERLAAEVQSRQADLSMRQQELSQRMQIASMDTATRLQIAGMENATAQARLSQEGSQFQQSEGEKRREFDLSFNQRLNEQNAQMANERLGMLVHSLGNDPMRQALLFEGTTGGTTPQEAAIGQIMKAYPLTGNQNLQDIAFGGAAGLQAATAPAPPSGMQQAVQPANGTNGLNGNIWQSARMGSPAVPPAPPQAQANAFNPAYAAQFAPKPVAHAAKGIKVPEAETGGKSLAKAAEGEVVSASKLTDGNPPIEKIKTDAVPGGDYAGDIGHSHTTEEGHIHGHDHAWTDAQGQHSGYHLHDVHQHPQTTPDQLQQIVPGEHLSDAMGNMRGTGDMQHMAGGGYTPTIVGERAPELAMLPPGAMVLPLPVDRNSTYAEQDRAARKVYPDMVDYPNHAAQGFTSTPPNWVAMYYQAMKMGRSDIANAIVRAQSFPRQASGAVPIGEGPIPTGGTNTTVPTANAGAPPRLIDASPAHYAAKAAVAAQGIPGSAQYQGMVDRANAPIYGGYGQVGAYSPTPQMQAPAPPQSLRWDPSAYAAETAGMRHAMGLRDYLSGVYAKYPLKGMGAPATGLAGYPGPGGVTQVGPNTNPAGPPMPRPGAGSAIGGTLGTVALPYQVGSNTNPPGPPMPYPPGAAPTNATGAMGSVLNPLTHMATGGYTPAPTYNQGGITYQRVQQPDGTVRYVNPNATTSPAPVSKPGGYPAPGGVSHVGPNTNPSGPPMPNPPGAGSVQDTSALALRNAFGYGSYNPTRFGGLPPLGQQYGVDVPTPESMAARYYNLPLPVQNLVRSSWGLAGIPFDEAERRMIAASPVGMSGMVTSQGAVSPFRYGREVIGYG